VGTDSFNVRNIRVSFKYCLIANFCNVTQPCNKLCDSTVKVTQTMSKIVVYNII